MIYYVEVVVILPIVIFFAAIIRFFKRIDRTAQIYQNAKAHVFQSQKVLDYLTEESIKANKNKGAHHDK